MTAGLLRMGIRDGHVQMCVLTRQKMWEGAEGRDSISGGVWGLRAGRVYHPELNARELVRGKLMVWMSVFISLGKKGNSS